MAGFRCKHVVPPLALKLALAALIACGLAFCGCGMVAQQQNVAGVRYFQQGQYPVAMQRFQQAVQANPQDADAYYNLAATTHRMGLANRDPNLMLQAEQYYNECLNRNPNHVDCHRGLAVLLTETNRTDKAFTLLRNWAVSSPSYSEPRIELARLYEEYGDLDTAERQLQQALQMDVASSRAHAALGQIREKRGDLTQALANYQRSYSLNRNQPGVATRIAALQAKPGATGTSATATPPLPPPRSASAPPNRLQY